jgi:sulfite exporter TauE/SafE/copper chaperone CopZ
MRSKTIPIRGMHCASCEILIGDNLKQVPGVCDVKVNHRTGEAVIQFDANEPSEGRIRQAVKDAGYDLGKNGKLPWISSDEKDYMDLARAAVIVFFLYLFARWLDIGSIDIENVQKTGVFVALLVGLVAGVSTCMALVGGLVLSLSARHAELHPEATPIQKFRPHIYFNIGRIVGYGVLGGLIGMIGAIAKPSTTVLAVLTIVVGAVMVFFGLKLIEIFPALKNKNITLPTSVARFFGLGKDVKEYSATGSVLLGAMTFFLPCGFTQAMQLYAISTGSFTQGMMIMGLFAIGTAPGLLGIGGLTSVFSGRKARVFFMVAGLIVIWLGWINIVNGRYLLGNKLAARNNPVVESGESQIVRITQNAYGYSPNVVTIKKGKPVKLIVNSTSAFSCASSLVIPSYGIGENLKAGENIIEFTPTEAGEIPFSCSMGMYRGKFIVTE